MFWHYLWTHLVLTGKRTWDTTPYPLPRTCKKHEFPGWLLLPRILPMPPGTQMSSVPPAPSSFMWSERICDSVPFRPLLCPQSWKWLLCMSRTLATLEGLKGQLAFLPSWDQPADSEGQFLSFCLRLLPVIPWLGKPVVASLPSSPRHHATARVYKPGSLFCSAFQPPHRVPAFSVHRNATCHSP